MTPKSLLAPARLAGRPVLRSQSDERLVDLVRAGSEPAFEAIVSRYRAPLLRYCRRILPEARAEDAVQQALVSAFAALRRDDSHIDLRPWLYRIAHNTALNALRDRALGHSELDERIDGVERPDQAMERRQGLREVIAAVQALPERQRNAMVLRELEGRSYDEIAGELGVSGGAVRQLLNRARTTLRAGVTAVTPMPLLLRLSTGDVDSARIGELVGTGGAGALATKVAATALVTGAVAGGIATVPDDHRDGAKVGEPPAATAASHDRRTEAGDVQASDANGTATNSENRGSDQGTAAAGDRGDAGDGDSSGSDDGSGDGHSGSGSSGPASGEPGDDGHSGSGTSGSSGPGPGTETDTTSSNEGPGAGGSGSSNSGPGSLSSGSDDSGSGSSGSGSSGSTSSGPGDGTTTTTSDSSGPG